MPPLLERVLPPAEAVRPPASEPPMPKPLSADLSAVPSADLAATVRALVAETVAMVLGLPAAGDLDSQRPFNEQGLDRSEEHTSELQSLMRISYAVLCLKK